MSSNTTPKESSDHLEQRKTLIKLEAAIDALKVHTLDASQLDELNIKRQPMALNKDSDLKPHFFAPKSNLRQPSKKLIRKTVEHLNNKDAFTDAMSRAHHFERDWSDYAFSDTMFTCENELWRSMESVSSIIILRYVVVIPVPSL
ncbi:hypothetical protein N7527_005160 [Penicillium freii]|uniref:Uncharacterized protein n=1 Tax=Penicillium freii TaxID=48697 RepID=A0A117NK42_PENFR|nr:hypothetical protein N7527_005160 [Penicillium freii]KUM55506.1 hypothetical protein ACN42_g11760 [Penicillium freii]